jgi:hypothetical protein
MSVASASNPPSCFSKVYEIAGSCYETLSRNETQRERVCAVGRTVLGLVSTVSNPFCAVAGAIATATCPTIAKGAVSAIDAGITGIWNGMDFRTKCISSAVGLTLVCLYPPLIAPITGTFAAKLGAEKTLKHLVRERIATAHRRAEQSLKEENLGRQEL